MKKELLNMNNENQVAAIEAAAEPKAAAKTEAPKAEPKEAPKAEEPKPEAKKHTAKKAKTAAELQAEIAAKTAELQKTLKDLERKQKLNEQRKIFLETLDNVHEFGEQLKKDEENFQSDGMKLSFFGSKYGNGRADFSVSARPILQDFITFISDKIDKRIKELETELIK